MENGWLELYQEGEEARIKQNLAAAAEKWEQALNLLLQDPNHNKSSAKILRDITKEVYVRIDLIEKNTHPIDEFDFFQKTFNVVLEAFRRGDFVSAAGHWKAEFEVRKKVLGLEHPRTLASLTNLAITVATLGDFQTAKQLAQQTLDAKKSSLGQNDSNTLLSLGLLASIEGNLGDYQTAKELGQQTLEIQRKVLGFEHPNTLLSMCNLGNTKSLMGDYLNAQELLEQALENQQHE
jgi:tetratricopeptide (TPR) repeat protein